ncbi:hypothetical protein A0U94_00170 [Gluconobacter albidus]|uniref:hypothetical protein n=1 Tax=Gluconobacter albidus TaxID=318683 RepID=UPI00098A2E8A|nr:hypothetical protein [Gluconobacter albidus]AQS89630.1 hypothetical protein A0U94_00170 [Gluconobacter albidus]
MTLPGTPLPDLRAYPHLEAEEVAALVAESGSREELLKVQDLWRAKHLRDVNAMAIYTMLMDTDDLIGAAYASGDIAGFQALLARRISWFSLPLERCALVQPPLALDMQLTSLALGDTETARRWAMEAVERGDAETDDGEAIKILSQAFTAAVGRRYAELLRLCSQLEQLWAGRRTGQFMGKTAITIARALLAVQNRDAEALGVALDFRQKFLVGWWTKYAAVDRAAALFDVTGQAILALAAREGLACRGNVFSDPAFL